MASEVLSQQPRGSGKDEKHRTETQLQHGLATPAQSVEPDAARLEADKQRRKDLEKAVEEQPTADHARALEKNQSASTDISKKGARDRHRKKTRFRMANKASQLLPNTGKDANVNTGTDPDSNAGTDSDVDMFPVDQSDEMINSVYQEATPNIQRILNHQDDDVSNRNAIDALNEKLKQLCQKTEEDPNDVIISTRIFEDWQSKQDSLQNPKSSQEKAKFDLERRESDSALLTAMEDHGYPLSWLSGFIKDLPGQEAGGSTNSETTAPSIENTSTLPGFYKPAVQPGRVLEDGIWKTVDQVIEVSPGKFRLLLKWPGENNLDIYELVAASTFGKGAGKRYGPAQKLVLGKKEELRGKSLEDMHIGGVARVRRDPKKTYSIEPMTIVRSSWGSGKEWFARSTLGSAFGQTAVDNRTRDYEKKAGQERQNIPLMERKKSDRNKEDNIGKGKYLQKKNKRDIQEDPSPSERVEEPVRVKPEQDLTKRIGQIEALLKQLVSDVAANE